MRVASRSPLGSLVATLAVATDERGKPRGVLQPVIDGDPFYGMAPRADAPAAASR